MIVYPRSRWTSVIPRPLNTANEFSGLPYFDDPPVGISFHQPEDEILYVYRNPTRELERLRKISVQATARSDIDYNYAISQNTEGVYVLRGGITKCVETDGLRVLMLIGRNEEPTDLMKKNQDDFINSTLSNPFPMNPMQIGDADVHVFNLIEYLAEKGLIQSRNDGVFSLFVEHAIQRLQKNLSLHIDGQYSMWVINALQELDREYIGV